MKEELISNKGQILLENLLVLFLTSIFLSIIFSFLRSYQLLNIYSENYLHAQEIAFSEKENLKSLAKTNFDQIKNETRIIDNFYKENILVTDLDNYTKKIELEIKWQEQREKSYKISFYLTDWKNSPLDDGSGGATGGGGSGLIGDWQNPRTLASIDLGSGNRGTDVSVKFNTVFISSIASDEKKPDLFIIDVSDPSSPYIKSSINTGKGVNSLSVRNNYVYLVHNNNQKQFQIVDISNENSPQLIKQVTLPNNYAFALSVFAFDHYVVIGTKKNPIGKEIVFIYDVQDSLNPQLLSSLETSGLDANDLFVLNKKLYIASGISDRGLILVYDINTPSSPRFLYSFSIPGKRFLSIFPLSDNLLFTGTQDYLYLLDTSSTTNIQILGSYNAQGKINDIYAREGLAFLATDNSNTEFQVVNYSDPTNLYLYSSYNFPQSATGIDYRNNLVFLSVRSNDALRILTSSQ